MHTSTLGDLLLLKVCKQLMWMRKSNTSAGFKSQTKKFYVVPFSMDDF